MPKSNLRKILINGISSLKVHSFIDIFSAKNAAPSVYSKYPRVMTAQFIKKESPISDNFPYPPPSVDMSIWVFEKRSISLFS